MATDPDADKPTPTPEPPKYPAPSEPDDRIAKLEGQLAQLLARSEYATKEEMVALNAKIDDIGGRVEEAMRQPVIEPPPPPVEPVEPDGGAAAPAMQDKTWKPKLGVF